MKRLLFLAATVALATAAHADVKLPAILNEGMVLQRSAPLNFWGWADDGEQVTVEFLGQKKTVTAKNGKWELTLKAIRTAGGPFPLTISGKNKIEFKDILVGEVWVCSGQSNMEWTLKNSFQSDGDIAKSANPNLRLFMVKNTRSDSPKQDVEVQQPWGAASPETAAGFSAVGYYFGRMLQEKLGVPIGLISSDWGGTPAEAWTPEERLTSNPELKKIVESYPAARARYDEQLKKWEADSAQAKAEGKRAPNRPNLWRYSELYNAMIAPITHFGIRGAIWYQGESNASRAMQYRELFPTMIESWRSVWDKKDMPFYLVQLAPYQGTGSPKTEYAELREAQTLATQRLKNVGMAVITDVGEEKDIHPKKKQPVGERLALLARRDLYKEKGLVAQGPSMKKVSFDGAKAVVTFENTGTGLMAASTDSLGNSVEAGKVVGFTVAGSDGVFYPAEAVLEGTDRVVVTCAQVPSPKAVRYAFINFPITNLWNKEGLPANPFRSDMPK
ncbi:sialate O-acetylesterase [Armatimonas rosea]|uniref:Sialate O-acetylesterase n=1 Tax=Armatimonas rosea TaxID=685828 RepID=A0A7W9W868_ARMRO|nr:sialate O-acetylesterase [Armatimonas rosea]MBB6053194.1 sialate O-acetylesterase [Armatimonas rosea]